MMTISKKKFVKLVHSRFSKLLTENQIYDGVSAINELILQKLLAFEDISVSGLGTFSTALHSSHKAVALVTGEEFITSPRLRLYLRPDISFVEVAKSARRHQAPKKKSTKS